MIFCCCNQAAEGCSDTCTRWRGTSGPDHVVCVPSWKKGRSLTTREQLAERCEAIGLDPSQILISEEDRREMVEAVKTVQHQPGWNSFDRCAQIVKDAEASVEAACRYAESLNWDKEEE